MGKMPPSGDVVMLGWPQGLLLLICDFYLGTPGQFGMVVFLPCNIIGFS